jgi:hypothetical protein
MRCAKSRNANACRQRLELHRLAFARDTLPFAALEDGTRWERAGLCVRLHRSMAALPEPQSHEAFPAGGGDPRSSSLRMVVRACRDALWLPGLQPGRASSIPLFSLDEDKRPVKFNGCSAPSLSVGTSALQRWRMSSFDAFLRCPP